MRVADAIRREVAILLLSKSKDPRLLPVSVSRVTVSKDMKRATIFYTVFGNDDEVHNAEAGLAGAKGFIRRHLAQTLDLRVTPVLDFAYDRSLVHQEALERLFKEIGAHDDEITAG
jgi:ribosome-binding factor A